MNIVLIHNIMSPYRLPLFSNIAEAAPGNFSVLFSGVNHDHRRHWHIDQSAAEFPYRVLPGRAVVVGQRGTFVNYGVSRSLTELSPSVVVLAGWDLPACWAARRWALRRNVPIVIWSESTQLSGRLRSPAADRVRRAFLRGAVGALVPGTAAEKYLRTLVTENLHVFYMPNPIGQPKLRDVQPCVTQVATNALFLGELSERKGADIVLVAMASLLELFDTVTFAGDGPLRHDVREAARYEPRLRYIGYADEAVKAAAIAEATVVLVPSRRDPWPLVAVEALTAARPVVLGPGVGSADDLAGFGACVQRMVTSSSRELTRCARSYG